MVFFDIIVSYEGCKIFIDLVKWVVVNINIFFIVGGGINELSDVDWLLNVGVDKVFINLLVICNLDLVDKIVKYFGL